MANADHVKRLLQGVNVWNAWRAANPSVRPDLSGAGLDLANLEGADLRKADLSGVQLDSAILCGAKLQDADLRQGNLFGANLTGASLQTANLRFANLLDVNLKDADLTGAFVYGASVWKLTLDHTTQRNLVITAFGEPEITVDDIEVAQFVYLLLNNEKIRGVIDTITSKVVLILGRFTPERKAVLDKLRDELRRPERAYVPVMFDFDRPQGQSTLETVTLLARLARFVIADISDAKSVLQELQAIVPNSPMLPVQAVITAAQEEPGMFDFFRKYPWFLKTYRYDDPVQLIANLDERVIRPAEAEVLELRAR
jgi:hypothetical protein